MSDSLAARAQRRGIETHWTDIGGVEHAVATATIEALLDALGAEPVTPERAVVAWDGVAIEGSVASGRYPFGAHRVDELTTVYSAPRRAHAGPPDAQRSWGVFAPTAALRGVADSRTIGDLGSLRQLANVFCEVGAAAIGTLPILAMFGEFPVEASPYRPVSRQFWNEVHLDIDAIVTAFGLDRAMLPTSGDANATHVDFAIEMRRVEAVLDTVQSLRVVGQDLDAYLKVHPEVLDYARFRATQDRFGRDWRGWHQHTNHAETDNNVITRHCLAQYLMDTQMRELQGHLGSRGQYLYLDLPVGAHPDGYDTWKYREAFVDGVSLGAPPDDFFAGGQCWGLPATHPQHPGAMYEMLSAALHHNARYAGVLRIDHVMGFHRQWWVPDGFEAAQGAYVRHNADVAWAAVTTVSHRHGTAIVGENLGTVPVAVNDAVDDHGAARMFVVQFEHLAGTTALRRSVPGGSLACLNTHDLERFATFWSSGGDELVPTADARATLLTTLGASDAKLVMLDVADLWEEVDPYNVPGTSGGDNWSRRYPVAIQDIDVRDNALVCLDQSRRMAPSAEASRQRGIQITEVDLHLLGEGGHFDLHQKLGAHAVVHGGVAGVVFTVWAPGAKSVSVSGDWNGWSSTQDSMYPLGVSGVWETFVAGAMGGTRYKFRIGTRDGRDLEKADPMARASELPPGNASIVTVSKHVWNDASWISSRADRQHESAPISIYEVHLGSWRRGGAHGDRVLTYRELAPLLAQYCCEMGYSHIECMPVMEHPFTGSWGYQVTGFFAPTARYGDPDDFRYFVDYLHQAGIGVLLDWVPAHFPDDAHGLANFNGDALYEHADPREGRHPDWGSLIFNYGRNEVVSFLISNALYWIDEFHIDGLRVDAVASMLYRDYSREAGAWIPNRFGGRENLEAIALLRRCSDAVASRFPDAMFIAEESTSWPGVTAPTEWGGLGFTSKWDLGWMHDTLEYLQRDPIHRRWHHNELTFRAMYSQSERFMLPLSHDEVVHGKGSLLTKMAGDDWQQRANLRVLLALQCTTPGKKLIFMGGEFGQHREWNHDASLDWHLLDDERHRGIARWSARLNNVLGSTPALHRYDNTTEGFVWLDADNREQSVLAWLRCTDVESEAVVVVVNCTPTPRENHRIGLPHVGPWHLVANSDDAEYGGSDFPTSDVVYGDAIVWHGQPYSAPIVLPPLSAIMLAGDRAVRDKLESEVGQP